MKTYAYRIQFWKLYRLKKSRINYEKKIENIRIQIKKYLATKKIKHIIKKQSFYIWIASFLPFKAIQIEFCLYMFPAIFVDIIAPLGMMIFLTMKGKQND